MKINAYQKFYSAWNGITNAIGFIVDSETGELIDQHSASYERKMHFDVHEHFTKLTEKRARKYGYDIVFTNSFELEGVT